MILRLLWGVGGIGIITIVTISSFIISFSTSQSPQSSESSQSSWLSSGRGWVRWHPDGACSHHNLCQHHFQHHHYRHDCHHHHHQYDHVGGGWVRWHPDGACPEQNWPHITERDQPVSKNLIIIMTTDRRNQLDPHLWYQSHIHYFQAWSGEACHWV